MPSYTEELRAHSVRLQLHIDVIPYDENVHEIKRLRGTRLLSRSLLLFAREFQMQMRQNKFIKGSEWILFIWAFICYPVPMTIQAIYA